MGRRLIVLTFLLACAGLCAAPGFAAPLKPAFLVLFQAPAPLPPLVFDYRGWHVDAATAALPPRRTARLVRAQLDIVEAVGLKPDVLNMMRGVPIRITSGAGPEAAFYSRAGGLVAIAGRLDPGKPIFLRHLLAAYYDQRLAQLPPAGVEIAAYRREILARRVWPKSATMLQNDRDFFAITSAAYLYGAITREPYNRANLRTTQPDYYQWLVRLFDDGTARR